MVKITDNTDGKEQIDSSGPPKLNLPICVYTDILKFLTLKEIVGKLMMLNKSIRNEIKTQNYLVFKVFCKEYSLNKRIERSDFIANHDVFKLIKDNMMQSKTVKQEDMKPFTFYTDGGVDLNNITYSFTKLFDSGMSLYASQNLNLEKFKTGINVQAYIGRKTWTPKQYTLNDYRKDTNDSMVFQMPIEPQLTDAKEQESFKQITDMTINATNQGYTSLCQSFVMFVNEKEIKCTKSSTLKAF